MTKYRNWQRPVTMQSADDNECDACNDICSSDKTVSLMSTITHSLFTAAVLSTPVRSRHHAIILARFFGRSGGGLCRLARARNASATRWECDWIIPFQPGVSMTSVAWLQTHTSTCRYMLLTAMYCKLIHECMTFALQVFQNKEYWHASLTSHRD